MRIRFPSALRNLRIWICTLTGGILFAAFDRCGYLLKRYGTIWAVSENPWHRTVFHRILCRLPAYVLAVLLLLLAVEALRMRYQQRKSVCSLRWTPFTRWKYWFPAVWAIYFVSFLPAFLGGFPGIFAADAPNQVGWTFSGWLTAHHPLLHTGILCLIFSATRALGLSDNIAAAIYTLLQMAALSGIFACLSRFLKKEKAPGWLRVGTAIYLCLFPFHGMMAVYTTKDTIFAGIFVLCVMQVYRMCTRPEVYFGSRQNLVRGTACFVLLFLFRNNGLHTLLLCAPFLLIYLRKYWKRLALMFACVLLCSAFYNGPLLTVLGAEAGNAREAYSVIMQTLGRTYVAGGDISEEEMDVIRPVMSEETLALYAEDISDPIKNYFDTEAFSENKWEFLKTWVSVGLKNKKIYIDAFLNTTDALWYPGTDEEYLEFVCFDIEQDNENYPHVQMTPVVEAFYDYYSAIGTDAAFRDIPVIRELLSMGLYFWLLVFASLYVVYRREYSRLLWLLLFWTYMATCFLGPSAALRYSYPVMLGAPLLIYFMVSKKQRHYSQPQSS
ncbi:MAG: DUF6020 family protein [Lachnospiraceae bacterium]|nr:DUF6020 family protein [Lachnospiraceae bacterium]